MILANFKNSIKLLRLYICQSFRELKGGKFVHVIGDSHTLSFQNCALKIHYLGPVTAYNLINDNSSTSGRKKLFEVIKNLKKGEQVLLVLGEIDTRIHVFNQYMKNSKKITMEKIMDSIIKNYQLVIEQIQKEGMHVMVYNIVPPGSQGNIYKYPYYANWKTRLQITQKMNNKLKRLCLKLRIPFINIYDQVINPTQVSPRGFRKKEYVFDDVHLHDRVSNLVVDQLKQTKVL